MATITPTQASTDEQRRELLAAVAATFNDGEEQLPTQTVCERLPGGPEDYDPDDFDDDEPWDPQALAQVLRRVGVFTNDLWPAPWDGTVIIADRVRSAVVMATADPERRTVPAAGEQPREQGGTWELTTTAGSYLSIYRCAPGVAMQVIGGSCGDPEAEVIARFSRQDLDHTIAVLTAMRDKTSFREDL